MCPARRSILGTNKLGRIRPPPPNWILQYRCTNSAYHDLEPGLAHPPMLGLSSTKIYALGLWSCLVLGHIRALDHMRF